MNHIDIPLPFLFMVVFVVLLMLKDIFDISSMFRRSRNTPQRLYAGGLGCGTIIIIAFAVVLFLAIAKVNGWV